jgi:hypothetical protein
MPVRIWIWGFELVTLNASALGSLFRKVRTLKVVIELLHAAKIHA